MILLERSISLRNKEKYILPVDSYSLLGDDDCILQEMSYAEKETLMRSAISTGKQDLT